MNVRDARMAMISADAATSAGRKVAMEHARATLARRTSRNELLGPGRLFREPAWDLLIELFIHQCEQRPLSISSLCIGSGLPMTSALRLVDRLCKSGYIDRATDPADARRKFAVLTPDIMRNLTIYFLASAKDSPFKNTDHERKKPAPRRPLHSPSRRSPQSGSEQIT